jgi:hypothetical protein
MGIELLLNSYFFNCHVFIVCEELCVAVFADSQWWKTDALYDLKITIWHGNSGILQTFSLLQHQVRRPRDKFPACAHKDGAFRVRKLLPGCGSCLFPEFLSDTWLTIRKMVCNSTSARTGQYLLGAQSRFLPLAGTLVPACFSAPHAVKVSLIDGPKAWVGNRYEPEAASTREQH